MILCCGEALIDMMPGLDDSGQACFVPHPAGAVYNTAIAAGRLGAAVQFFCGLSQDMFGALLEEGLKSSGVESELCPRYRNPCTLAFVRIENGQAQYAFYDENTALRALRETDLPKKLPSDVEAIFLGGISLTQGQSADAFAAMASRGAQDCVVMIDPNIRPDFIADRDRYIDRLRALMRVCDVVKLSDEDLIWLLGPGDLDLRAREILAMGPRLVLLTLGSKGVRAYQASGVIERPARKTQVVDTVGAGDTFSAGFLVSLQRAGLLRKSEIAQLEKSSLIAALDLGVAAAAVTVSRRGANPPWAEELDG